MTTVDGGNSGAPVNSDPNADVHASPNSVDLNRLSLEQALMDVEVANLRVVDLTQRLIALSQDLAATRNELETTKIVLQQHVATANTLSAELEQVRTSTTFRVARGLSLLRHLTRS